MPGPAADRHLLRGWFRCPRHAVYWVGERRCWVRGCRRNPTVGSPSLNNVSHGYAGEFVKETWHS